MASRGLELYIKVIGALFLVIATMICTKHKHSGVFFASVFAGAMPPWFLSFLIPSDFAAAMLVPSVVAGILLGLLLGMGLGNPGQGLAGGAFGVIVSFLIVFAVMAVFSTS